MSIPLTLLLLHSLGVGGAYIATTTPPSLSHTHTHTQSERKALPERSILSLYRHEPSSASNNQINYFYSKRLTVFLF